MTSTTGVDTPKFAKKFNIVSLKPENDKLHLSKLKNLIQWLPYVQGAVRLLPWTKEVQLLSVF